MPTLINAKSALLSWTAPRSSSLSRDSVDPVISAAKSVLTMDQMVHSARNARTVSICLKANIANNASTQVASLASTKILKQVRNSVQNVQTTTSYHLRTNCATSVRRVANNAPMTAMVTSNVIHVKKVITRPRPTRNASHAMKIALFVLTMAVEDQNAEDAPKDLDLIQAMGNVKIALQRLV